jgi:hypothetical protein
MKSYFPPRWYAVIIFICLLVVSAGFTCNDPPFNKVQKKHSHNSYAWDRNIFNQVVVDMIRSVELDLHNGGITGDWKVYHINSSVDDKTLSYHLQEIKKIENYYPNHEVITIYLELKNAFEDAVEGKWKHTPYALDTLLKTYIAEDKIFMPKDLLKRCVHTSENACSCSNDSSISCSCGSLTDTVKKCGWPNVSELRGKYIFVVFDVEGQSVSYRTYSFINELLKLLKVSSQETVAFQENGDGDVFKASASLNYSQDDYNNGILYRVWQANKIDDWVSAINKNIQYIGTDIEDYFSDNWATTNNTREWPFRCMGELYDCSNFDENPNFSWYPDGFPHQIYWGSRYNPVPYFGVSEWFLDLNGDEKADYIYNIDFTTLYSVMLSGGDKFNDATSWGSISYDDGYETRSEWFVDVNGDKLPDHVYIFHRDPFGDLRVKLNEGNKFGIDTLWGSRTATVANNGLSEWFLDLNGDKKADYIYKKNGSMTYGVMLSLGSGFGPDTSWGGTTYEVGNKGRSDWFVDVNGDTLPDHVYNPFGTRELRVSSNLGNKFDVEKLWGSRTTDVAKGGLSEWFVDLNGDKKADYIYNKNGSQTYGVMLSLGNGFNTDTSWGSSAYVVGFGGTAQWFVDINGDKLPDHVYNRDGTNQYWVRYNTGSGFAADQLLSRRVGNVDYSVGKPEWFIDVNGDGKADHISNRAGTPEIWVRLNNF